jgi:hypothetical protein
MRGQWLLIVKGAIRIFRSRSGLPLESEFDTRTLMAARPRRGGLCKENFYDFSGLQRWALRGVIEKMAGNQTRTLVKIPKLVGKYKQVRVSFLGASFLSPGNTKEKRYQDDSFGPFILDEIFRRQSILSKRKGILKKNHHCRRCDADLMGLKAHRRRFTLDVVYKDAPPFKIDIEMPAIPCRNCGTSNAVNEENTEQIICGAIAKAFEALGGILSDENTAEHRKQGR